MKSSGRLITSFTLFLAITSGAVMLAGCANPGGITPTARSIDAASLAQDTAPAVDVVDTWWKAFGDPRLDEPDRRRVAHAARADIGSGGHGGAH